MQQPFAIIVLPAIFLILNSGSIFGHLRGSRGTASFEVYNATFEVRAEQRRLTTDCRQRPLSQLSDTSCCCISRCSEAVLGRLSDNSSALRAAAPTWHRGLVEAVQPLRRMPVPHLWWIRNQACDTPFTLRTGSHKGLLTRSGYRRCGESP